LTHTYFIEWYKSCFPEKINWFILLVWHDYCNIEHMRNLHLSWKQLAALAGIIVLFFLLMDLNNRMTDLARLNNQQARMNTEVGNLQQTEQALSTSMVFSTSDAAAIEYARIHGLVQDGEKLVVPLSAGTPEPLQYVEPEQTVQPISNLEIWWALFFGS
jgi:cell division protein FtsB